MAKRAIKIAHKTPVGLPYAILPVGMKCNAKLQEAKEGDVVEFTQDWKCDKRVLVRKCRMPVKSSFFIFMVQSIYGKYMRVDELIKQWEVWADVNGIGKRGFDHESMMLIEVREPTRFES